MVGVSRQLHAILHGFDPVRIGPAPGPYDSAVVAQVFGRFVTQNRPLLTSPAYPGMFMANGIPEVRLLSTTDMLPFNEIANMLRRHLVLLDIVPVPPGGPNQPP
jgi:hypothetical protein